MNKTIKQTFFGLIVLLGLIALPHFLSYHHQDMLIFMVINILVVASYRIVTLTGEWSLIHAVMMGVGAYTAALLSINFGFQLWATLPIAAAVAGFMAFLLSFPLFRTTQFYFLIGSFAAGEAIRLLWIYLVVPFGGTGGMSGAEAPIIGSIDFFEPIPYYYLSLFIVGICLLLLLRVERSRVGLVLHAVHWQPRLAQSVGIDTFRYRMLAFVVGSVFVAIAGALKVHYLGTVTPKQFDIGFMVFILIWIVVGGYNRFYGPILGVIVLTVLDETIRSFEEIRPAIYGLVLIIAMLYLPRGLETLGERWTQARKNKEAAADHVANQKFN